ncbi:ubiquitin-protein ligase (E3) [Rhodotorula toruloides]
MDSLFTGSARARPQINLGGRQGDSNQPASHLDLVQRARQEREQRERDRKKATAALSIQAFYRGRKAARQARSGFRTQFDAIIPVSTPANAPPPSPDKVLAASRLLATAYSPGDKEDVKRLAAWCRTVLKPAQGATDKTPLLFSLYRVDSESWTTLSRTIGTLLFTEATASPLLPQSPLFLEIAKILADPASYAKWKTPAQVPKDGLLAYLLEEKALYPRVGKAIASIPPEQRSHPSLSALISLSLLPFRAYPPPTSPTSAASPRRAAALLSFALSILTVPLLIPCRLSPALLTTLTTSIPCWDLLVSLTSDVALPQLAALSEGETAVLLAHVVELGKARLSASAKGAAGVENGKQALAYLDCVRGLLTRSPVGVFEETSGRKEKGKERAVAVEEDDGDDEDVDDEEVERARVAIGTSRDRDDEGDAIMSPAPPSVPSLPARLDLDSRVRASLRHIASPAHVATVLALSNRYSASTRPALSGLLVTLLAHLSSPSLTLSTAPSSSSSPSSHAPSLRDQTLNALLYSPSASGLLRELYRGYIRSSPLGRTLSSAKREKSGVVLAALSDEKYKDEWPVLVLALEMYSRSLVTMGDDEFYSSAGGAFGAAAAGGANSRNPLTLDEVIGLSGMIRNAAFAMYWQDDGTAASNGPGADGVVGTGGWRREDVRALMTRFLQQVHARDSRRQFTPEGHWHMTGAIDMRSFVETAVYEDNRLDNEGEGPDDQPALHGPISPEDEEDHYISNDVRRRLGLRGQIHRSARGQPAPRTRSSVLSKRQLALISPRLGILNNIPFVVPFETRVAIFRQFIDNDFAKLGLGEATSYAARSRHRAVVRRTHLAEDAYTHMNGLGPELKKRIEIVFIDEHGMEESGIDGGGLFKELLTSLSKEVFDTNRGLWLATSEQEIYPNPHAYAKESTQLSWFTFVGRILGKAIYSGILVNVKFANFFLAKWLGRQSYLDDLASLDPELYNGLLKLKNYPGNVEDDLALNFTITEEDFGVSRSIDLIPGGSEIPVTNDNRMQYIVLVSNHRLNVQIAPQCRAFYQGLFEIINPRWLHMFNQSELAILVGGTEEAIDIDDLKANTVYSGFAEEENTPTIRAFWDVVESFDKDQRAKLVKFVTACERPPLLGFGQLNPKFAIRNAGGDQTRLPTSATCVNLLKLPDYQDPNNLREKLIYAINSGAGFDLS